MVYLSTCVYTIASHILCGILFSFLSQLAEKRKTILDEMSIKGQESATEQQKKMDELEEKHKVSKFSSSHDNPLALLTDDPLPSTYCRMRLPSWKRSYKKSRLVHEIMYVSFSMHLYTCTHKHSEFICMTCMYMYSHTAYTLYKYMCMYVRIVHICAACCDT